MRRRKPEPLAANVVDVGEDVGDSTHLLPGKFGAPYTCIEMLQQQLVHLLVHEKSLSDLLCKIRIWWSRATRHGIFSTGKHIRSIFSSSVSIFRVPRFPRCACILGSSRF